jgi:hypothetical protein
VLGEIRGFGDATYILEDGYLSVLNIRKAEPLDIEEQYVDFAPRFFLPRFTLDQARQKTEDFLADHREHLEEHSIWPRRCRRGSFISLVEETPGPYDPEERHPLCDPQTDADFRLQWFLTATAASYFHPWGNSPNLGVWEGSAWFYMKQVETLASRVSPRC